MDPWNQRHAAETSVINRLTRRRRSARGRRVAVSMLACLSGGTLLTTCQARLRDATVQASKDLVFSLLDPTTIVNALLGTGSSSGG